MCGVEIAESRVALAVIATLACLLLLAFTGLGVWVEGRYQRSEAVKHDGRGARWRPPEEREEGGDGSGGD